MRYRLIPAALAAGASLALLAGTAMAATPTAWSIVASPAGLISVDRISAASATDIWASAHAPQQTIAGVPVPVAKTLHWNGTAWSVMPGPTASDPGTAVTGLSALPSGEARAVGATFSATAATAFIAHHTP